MDKNVTKEIQKKQLIKKNMGHYDKKIRRVI